MLFFPHTELKSHTTRDPVVKNRTGMNNMFILKDNPGVMTRGSLPGCRDKKMRKQVKCSRKRTKRKSIRNRVSNKNNQVLFTSIDLSSLFCVIHVFRLCLYVISQFLVGYVR